MKHFDLITYLITCALGTILYENDNVVWRYNHDAVCDVITQIRASKNVSLICMLIEGGHYVDHQMGMISPHSPPHSLQYSKNLKND